MPATSAIYQNKLSATDRGAALWYPEPHATGEVQLGDRDVGYISDGAFIRFFSLHPAPEPHYAVPAGYWTALPEPLPQYPNNAQVDIRERVIAPTALQSKGIVRTEIRAAATGSVPVGISCILKLISQQQRSSRCQCWSYRRVHVQGGERSNVETAQPCRLADALRHKSHQTMGP